MLTSPLAHTLIVPPIPTSLVRSGESKKKTISSSCSTFPRSLDLIETPEPRSISEQRGVKEDGIYLFVTFLVF